MAKKNVILSQAPINYLSKEGFEKLQKELHDLKFVQRPFISKQIADARDKGDLSENAEYHAAKEDQGHLETKISQIESLLSVSRVIDETKLDISKVMLLSKVKVLNHNVKKEFNYIIVSENEADFKAGKISVKSPIGAGLVGKKVGEIAEINAPAGTIKLEIMDISLS
jgi:transcription elongation factor GreA